MRRIMITYAGGALGLGFTRSLHAAPEPFHTIGIDSHPYMLQRAETAERHLGLRVDDEDYIPFLRRLIQETQPDLLCVQLSREMLSVSAARDTLGVRTFLPRHETLEVCENKLASQRVWERAGLPVPRTMLLRDEGDLRVALQEFGPDLWLRATQGSGGKDSLPVSDYETARSWIEFKRGWGRMTAAERLEKETVTWQSLWKNGELLVAQSKKRLYWEFGSISPSGVTGVTGASMTVSDPIVDEIAMAAVRAVDPQAGGIFGVDLTYDRKGVPNLTEINCGRMFTTHHFFTAAGVNMPYIFVKAAFGEDFPLPSRRINPLPPGLVWVRGMDRAPVLTDVAHVDSFTNALERRRASLRQGSRDLDRTTARSEGPDIDPSEERVVRSMRAAKGQ